MSKVERFIFKNQIREDISLFLSSQSKFVASSSSSITRNGLKAPLYLKVHFKLFSHRGPRKNLLTNENALNQLLPGYISSWNILPLKLSRRASLILINPNDSSEFVNNQNKIVYHSKIYTTKRVNIETYIQRFSKDYNNAFNQFDNQTG